jgi:hypothetical protein
MSDDSDPDEPKARCIYLPDNTRETQTIGSTLLAKYGFEHIHSLMHSSSTYIDHIKKDKSEKKEKKSKKRKRSRSPSIDA